MPTPRLHVNPAARQAAYRRRCAEARRSELAAKGVPALPTLATMPGNTRWKGLVRQASLLLGTVQEEMEEYYEHRSVTWQASERGAAFPERLQAVQETYDATTDLV